MTKLSDRIAADLFTNGRGDEAERLVLELPGRRYGGGWGLKPASDVIDRHVGPLVADLDEAISLLLRCRADMNEDVTTEVEAFLDRVADATPSR